MVKTAKGGKTPASGAGQHVARKEHAEARGLRSDVAPKPGVSHTHEYANSSMVSDVAPRWSHVESAPLSQAEPPRLSLSELLGPPPTDRSPRSLDEAVLARLNDYFSGEAGPDSRLDAAELKRSLKLSDPFLVERILFVFDQDCDGAITRVEFIDRFKRLAIGSARDKLRFAFRVHDLNGDNVIERDELTGMIQRCMVEEQMPDASAAAGQLTDVLMHAVDLNGNGRLSYNEFEAALSAHPSLLELVALSVAQWVVPDMNLEELKAERAGRRFRWRRFAQNRWIAVLLVTFWGVANVALFAAAALKYQALGANGFVMLARGCGACLNFNGALILIPVMRRFLTWIRRAPLLRVLPVDDAIAFHRLVGHSMFALALVHAGAHLTNYHYTGVGIIEGTIGTSAGLTGLSLLLVFAWMWFCSRRAIRRSGRFELFYFSHLLYIAWFALCLVHGPAFYKWALLPLSAFVLEQLVRAFRRGRATRVLRAEPLSSGVTRLELARPDGFAQAAGDYAFLRIPALARHEWHPFTISSAPERDTLTMHVRLLGNFTSRLSELVRARHVGGISEPLPAYLDGPYGTASAHIFEAKHAILVGAGIGVTPFASVLESIVLRARAGRTNLQHVHFFWLNRDPHSFEWFTNLLRDLEQLDQRHLVDINVYMTGGQSHIAAVALNLARELSHQQGRRDMVTGLRSKTFVGRPDWQSELSRIADQHAPERVDLFFCGPPGLGNQLRGLCRKLGLGFRQEHF